MTHARSQFLRFLPLWVAVVPLLTINVSYLVAIGGQHLPACIPYFSGCTSVSSTGRDTPESVIFKVGMLLSAVALVLLWQRIATFLQRSGDSPSQRRLSLPSIIKILSMLSAFSLTIYAFTLGAEGENFRLLRRSGINGFAVSNVTIEILFIVLYRPLRTAETTRLFYWLIIFCIALPLIGIAAELAKWLGAPRNQTNNIAAWNAFVALSGYYLVVARLWWYHKMSDGRAASPSE